MPAVGGTIADRATLTLATMADVSVRPARLEDAAHIARIQVTTWRYGYAAVLPPAVLDGLSLSDAQAAWAAAVASPPTPRHHVLVAEELGWLVGFAALAPLDEPDSADAPVDATVTIDPLLVEPRFGRRGHGSRLLAAAVHYAREDGMTRAVVWVPEADHASRSLFTSAGWAEEGLVRGLDTGAGELREIRLQAWLDEPPMTEEGA
jgi:L-amino acid N-acyltransferase YncA